VTVSEDTPLETIVELMEHHRIKRIPVMRGNDVVGIVTRSNLMHAMVSLARATPSAKQGDAEIRERILAEMKKEQWAPIATTNVVVHDGIVELWGVVVDERQREALRVCAENTAGVQAVKDHLVWVEPTSGMVMEPDDQEPVVKH